MLIDSSEAVAKLPDASAPTSSSFPLQELIGINTRLPQNGPQSSLRHVAGVVGDCRIAIGRGVEPDLVDFQTLDGRTRIQILSIGE